MGLGLPFVNKIIFEHRGDIKIVNSTTSGTHFQIRITQLEISDIEINSGFPTEPNTN